MLTAHLPEVRPLNLKSSACSSFKGFISAEIYMQHKCSVTSAKKVSNIDCLVPENVHAPPSPLTERFFVLTQHPF